MWLVFKKGRRKKRGETEIAGGECAIDGPLRHRLPVSELFYSRLLSSAHTTTSGACFALFLFFFSPSNLFSSSRPSWPITPVRLNLTPLHTFQKSKAPLRIVPILNQREKAHHHHHHLHQLLFHLTMFIQSDRFFLEYNQLKILHPFRV